MWINLFVLLSSWWVTSLIILLKNDSTLNHGGRKLLHVCKHPWLNPNQWRRNRCFALHVKHNNMGVFRHTHSYFFSNPMEVAAGNSDCSYSRDTASTCLTKVLLKFTLWRKEQNSKVNSSILLSFQVRTYIFVMKDNTESSFQRTQILLTV